MYRFNSNLKLRLITLQKPSSKTFLEFKYFRVLQAITFGNIEEISHDRQEVNEITGFIPVAAVIERKLT